MWLGPDADLEVLRNKINAEKLAYVLDRHSVCITRREARIEIASVDENYVKTLASDLKLIYGVNAHFMTPRAMVGRDDYVRKLTYRLQISKSADVLKLCKAALPYSRKKERLERAIELCERMLA